MHKSLLTAAAIAFAAPTLAGAAVVSPTGYTYITAPTSSSAYRDDTYNGTTGQLTDGQSATGDWQATDGFGAPGPNVGWEAANPIIRFDFDQVYDFAGFVMNFQDGQGIFGVIIPNSVIVTGGPLDSVTSPMLTGGTSVGALDTIVDLTALAPTDVLTVEVVRGASSWTMLSEFTFNTSDTAPVPVPAGLPLLAGGLLLLNMMRRRART